MPQRDPFLPNFCSVGSAFAVMLLSVLLALLLSLADTASGDDWWSGLGLRALFIVWVGLACAAVLCAGRRWLAMRSVAGASAAVLLLVVTMTAAADGLVERFLPAFSSSPGPTVRMLHNGLIAALVTALWLRYQYIQHQRRRQARAEGVARLDALQARMRPHFLFNSLNTVASLIRRDPAMAEELLLDLAELFRVILRQDLRLTTLGEEIRLAHQYLNIERQRLGERLQVVWRIDALPLDALLPPLSLQPLLENAVYHGVESSAAGGVVEICGRLVKGELVLLVSNPVPDTTIRKRRSGNQIALDNLRLRLESCFPGEGQLMISVVDGRYQVRIVIPYRSQT